jgi:hypothetical protein
VSEELVGLIPKKINADAVNRFKEEQTLYEKFGKEGMSLYVKIDGKRTLAELMSASGLPEARLLQVIGDMEKLGLIKVYTVFELEADEGG